MRSQTFNVFLAEAQAFTRSSDFLGAPRKSASCRREHPQRARKRSSLATRFTASKLSLARNRLRPHSSPTPQLKTKASAICNPARSQWDRSALALVPVGCHPRDRHGSRHGANRSRRGPSSCWGHLCIEPLCNPEWARQAVHPNPTRSGPARNACPQFRTGPNTN